MGAETTDSPRDSLLRFLRSDGRLRRPVTWLFLATAIVFALALAAGLAHFVRSHGGMPRLSLYVLEQGESYFRAGDFDAAALEFADAAAVSPADTQNQVNLGAAEYSRGNRQAAAAAFREALRFDADHPEANYFLGVIYLQEQRVEEAIALIRRSVAADPSRPAAYNDLGVAYSRRGDLSRAADSYRRALEVDPGFEAARRNLESVRRRMAGPG